MQWLSDTAFELGGTVYGVAEESGFLSSFSNIKRWMESDKKRYSNELPELPDLFAVRQAIRAYEAERLIRRTIDPYFSLEWRDRENCDVEYFMEHLTDDMFPDHWMTALHEGVLPEYSRSLMYQVCYIRFYYEDIYRKVWDKSRKEGDIFPPFFEAGCEPKTLGISLGVNECFAVYTDAAGKTACIPATFDKEVPENKKYIFRGSGDLCHAGIACSEVALLFQSIMKNKEALSGDPVEKVSVTYNGYLPGRKEIARARMEREKAQQQAGKNTAEFLADMQLEMLMDGRVPNGIEVIQESGTLAELPGFSAGGATLEATAKAYDARKEYHLKEGEIAAVIYLDNRDLRVGLVQKQEGKITWWVSRGEPEETVWHWADWMDRKKECDEALVEKMKDAVIPDLTELGELENERTQKAMEELAGDIGRVKRQFLRNDEAIIRFDNGYLQFTRKLPVSAYEECMAPLYEALVEILKDAVGSNHFSKILLAGERSADPGLRRYLYEHYPDKLCMMGDPEYVVALGTTAKV
jgi:hypothetical protein